MADDLQALEDWVQPLIAQLDRKARRQLARKVAWSCAVPSASASSPTQSRRHALRAPQATASCPAGAIRRRAMFSKIRTARYLKAKGTAKGAEVGFTSHVAHIARIHQEGRRALVDRDGPRIRYPERRLIGYTAEDRERSWKPSSSTSIRCKQRIYNAHR